MQNITDGIFILLPGSCPRQGAWGAGSKFIFVIRQIKGLDERNIIHVHFYPRVKLVTLGRGQWSYFIKIQLQSQFQRFLYQTLCAFSQMKIQNISNKIFIPLPGMGLWGTFFCCCCCFFLLFSSLPRFLLAETQSPISHRQHILHLLQRCIVYLPRLQFPLLNTILSILQKDCLGVVPACESCRQKKKPCAEDIFFMLHLPEQDFSAAQKT